MSGRKFIVEDESFEQLKKANEFFEKMVNEYNENLKSWIDNLRFEMFVRYLKSKRYKRDLRKLLKQKRIKNELI